jgi:hypothetical protein
MFGILGVLAALGLGIWRLARNRVPGLWTPERQALYRVAIAFETDPTKLSALAAKFQDEGFPDKAAALRARAKLPTVNGEETAKYATIARKAFGSKNPEAVRAVAAGFEQSGRGATADALRDYATGLDVTVRVIPLVDNPFPTTFHTARKPLGPMPNANPSGPPGTSGPATSSAPQGAPTHADLRADHAALHQDHAGLAADHQKILAAIEEVNRKLAGAPWLAGVQPGGDSPDTACVLVIVTDITPAVTDAVPTHARGVPVYVRDVRGN